jgi:hypothetical protein
MKTAPIEKFQYLVHLKATNPHLFYRLLSKNIKVWKSPHIGRASADVYRN